MELHSLIYLFRAMFTVVEKQKQEVCAERLFFCGEGLNLGFGAYGAVCKKIFYNKI